MHNIYEVLHYLSWSGHLQDRINIWSGIAWLYEYSMKQQIEYHRYDGYELYSVVYEATLLEAAWGRGAYGAEPAQGIPSNLPQAA